MVKLLLWLKDKILKIIQEEIQILYQYYEHTRE
jgi:hypothetical protein